MQEQERSASDIESMERPGIQSFYGIESSHKGSQIIKIPSGNGSLSSYPLPIFQKKKLQITFLNYFFK